MFKMLCEWKAPPKENFWRSAERLGPSVKIDSLSVFQAPMQLVALDREDHVER